MVKRVAGIISTLLVLAVVVMAVVSRSGRNGKQPSPNIEVTVPSDSAENETHIMPETVVIDSDSLSAGVSQAVR